MAKIISFNKFSVYSLSYMTLLGLLLIVGYIWYNGAGTTGNVHQSTRSVEAANVQTRLPLTQLWYNISNETIMWHMAHYEDRYFAYKAPAAIILMFFHYHLAPFPSLYLKVHNPVLDGQCREGHTIPFGKVIKAKGEVNYFYLVVFKIFNSTEVIPNYVHLYENDPTCISPPIIENIPIYYKHNETQIDFATCLYKGIIATKHIIPLDIISWIEVNRAIGVQHITMYDQELTPEILNNLWKYRQEGFVELIAYKVPHPEKTGYTGQLGTIQDCFYRYVRRAKYILFIDLDELIIPHQHNNLSDMMKFLNSTQKQVTQYRFFNSFWHLADKPALGNYEPSQDEPIPVHFQRSNRTKNCPKTTRHKNIIKVETAVRVGIHHVYKMKKGEKLYQVPEEIGLMHHYRRPDYARNEEQLEDMTMSKYAPQVMSRLKQE